jgi:hypothetical protein
VAAAVCSWSGGPNTGENFLGRLIFGLKPQDRLNVRRGLIAAAGDLEQCDAFAAHGPFLRPGAFV